jgi:hypothetical protein
MNRDGMAESGWRKAELRSSALFAVSTGVILALTALAKLASAADSAPLLELLDPILGVSLRSVLIGAGAIELLLAILLFRRPADITAPLLILAFASNCLLYRLALYAQGRRVCPCLGTVGQNLHLNERLLDTGLKIALLYMLVGSVWSMWRHRAARGRQRQFAAAAP